MCEEEVYDTLFISSVLKMHEGGPQSRRKALRKQFCPIKIERSHAGRSQPAEQDTLYPSTVPSNIGEVGSSSATETNSNESFDESQAFQHESSWNEESADDIGDSGGSIISPSKIGAATWAKIVASLTSPTLSGFSSSSSWNSDAAASYSFGEGSSQENDPTEGDDKVTDIECVPDLPLLPNEIKDIFTVSPEKLKGKIRRDLIKRMDQNSINANGGICRHQQALDKKSQDADAMFLTDVRNHLRACLPVHWQVFEDPDGLSLIRKSFSSGKCFVVQRNIFIHRDGTTQLFVHCQPLPVTNEVWLQMPSIEEVDFNSICEFSEYALKIVELVRAYEVCSGCPKMEDFDIASEIDRATLDTNPFWESKYSSTYRAKNCEMLVSTRKKASACRFCATLRSLIRKKASNKKKENVKTETNVKTTTKKSENFPGNLIRSLHLKLEHSLSQDLKNELSDSLSKAADR